MDAINRLHDEINEINFRLSTENMSSEEITALDNKKDNLFAELVELENPE
jgi:flagellar hook-associated protein FlgK